jgi:hypothetical protein
VIPPFDRSRLRERNAIDDLEHRTEATSRSPAERVERALELSDLVRLLAHATGADQHIDDRSDLEEKARLYAEPLRLLAGRACKRPRRSVEN